MAVPSLVKIYAPIGIESIKRKQDRGFMLWSLSRALDGNGQGRISPEVVREAVYGLKMSKNVWNKARKQALENNWLIEGTDGFWYIPSVEKTARRLELEYVGKYPVEVATNRLRLAGAWKSSIWSAFHASRGPRSNPISRKSLVEITGIPKRTQQHYERKTKVTKHANFKVLGNGKLPKGIDALARDNGIPGAFEVHGQLWIQISNSYSSKLKRAKRSSCRKINKSLRDDLLFTGDGERCRIYYSSKGKAVEAQKSSEYRYEIEGIPSGMQAKREIWYKKSGKTSSGASVFLCL
jgi:hypothetical protein